MDPVIRKFRGALGGFNRRDVLQYIEQSSAAHQRQVEKLERRLAQAEEERSILDQELAGLRDEKGSVAAEEARVRASLEESTRTLARLRGELTQTETQLKVAKAELQRLQAQVGELAPMAQNYGELKDRIATIELDAHRKAQATVDEANGQAEALREETRQWLARVLEEPVPVAAGKCQIVPLLDHASNFDVGRFVFRFQHFHDFTQVLRGIGFPIVQAQKHRGGGQRKQRRQENAGPKPSVPVLFPRPGGRPGRLHLLFRLGTATGICMRRSSSAHVSQAAIWAWTIILL